MRHGRRLKGAQKLVLHDVTRQMMREMNRMPQQKPFGLMRMSRQRVTGRRISLFKSNNFNNRNVTSKRTSLPQSPEIAGYNQFLYMCGYQHTVTYSKNNFSLISPEVSRFLFQLYYYYLFSHLPIFLTLTSSLGVTILTSSNSKTSFQISVKSTSGKEHCSRFLYFPSMG